MISEITLEKQKTLYMAYQERRGWGLFFVEKKMGI